jgi:hypothetical protein
MLEVREHRRVLSGVREVRGRQLARHRAELQDERRAWRQARADRPAAHRAVLEGERRAMQRTRTLHRALLAQNRWLLVLADRLQDRLKTAR